MEATGDEVIDDFLPQFLLWSLGLEGLSENVGSGKRGGGFAEVLGKASDDERVEFPMIEEFERRSFYALSRMIESLLNDSD